MYVLCLNLTSHHLVNKTLQWFSKRSILLGRTLRSAITVYLFMILASNGTQIAK